MTGHILTEITRLEQSPTPFWKYSGNMNRENISNEQNDDNKLNCIIYHAQWTTGILISIP